MINRPHTLREWSPWAHKVCTQKTSDDWQEGWSSAALGQEHLPRRGYRFHLYGSRLCAGPKEEASLLSISQKWLVVLLLAPGTTHRQGHTLRWQLHP